MKKSVLTILFACSLVFLFAQEDFSDVQITAESVKGNIHVLFGRGGNIGVLAGPDGFVLIDDQFAPLSEKIKAALREIGEETVTFTINTHFHFDNADGNKVFGPEGACRTTRATRR